MIGLDNKFVVLLELLEFFLARFKWSIGSVRICSVFGPYLFFKSNYVAEDKIVRN
jgi:hypothetical protein